MPPAPVLTFELTDEGPVPVHEGASLAEASAHLPHGAYSTIRTYGGRGIVRFDLHVRRLKESADSSPPHAAPLNPNTRKPDHLHSPHTTLDPAATRRLVTAALDATRHPESRLRLTFAPPRLFVSVEAFSPLPSSLYDNGVACVTLPHVHRDQPHVKDTHFIATARRAYQELPRGIEEALLLADDGSILEGLSSNFFAIMDGALHTEDERVLPGITRALVLDAARPHLPLVARAVRLDERPRVSEAFITSTSRAVLPVVRIDGIPVADGKVGAWARQLADAFAELVRREAEPFR